jgi:hypothetical protein
MSDFHKSASEKEPMRAHPQPVTPELDERVWLAWKEKNRAKDRTRAAHRRRLFMVLLVMAAVALIGAYSTGVIA